MLIRSIGLVALATAIDVAGANLALRLGLPVSLDLTGAFVAGALAGPLAGGAAGLLGALIWDLLTRPPALPFATTGLAIGLLAGWLGQRGHLDRWPGVVVGGLIAGAVGAVLVATIAAIVLAEPLPPGGSPVAAFLGRAGGYLLQRPVGDGVVPQPLDVAASFLIGRVLLEAVRPQPFLAT